MNCVGPRIRLNLPSQRSSVSRWRVRAKQRPFNEGAAQVSKLLDRDEAELTGVQGIGSVAYTEFGQDAGEDKLETVEDFPEAFLPSSGGDVEPIKAAPSSIKRASVNLKSAPSSPFGRASSPVSPFGGGNSRVPEEGLLSPTMKPEPVEEKPWWSRITKTQLVLACTFSLMTLSMLGTVWLVAKTGAIHFNDLQY